MEEQAAVTGLSLPPVETCDGEALAAVQARATARRYYLFGFAALPWFWVCNVWLFFPDFWHRRDPVVAKCECSVWCSSAGAAAAAAACCRRPLLAPACLPADTRQSALWFCVYTALFLPWFLLYIIGAPGQRGQHGCWAAPLRADRSCCLHPAALLSRTRHTHSSHPAPTQHAAGKEVLGEDAYNSLDINRLDLSSAGLGGG